MFNKKFLSFLLLIGLILTILSINIPFSKATNPPPIEWIQWTKTYGGTSNDYATSMIQTSDEGYVLAGTTRSFGAGLDDFWLIKTDAYGNQQWNKTYGGVDHELASCVVQTKDNGYALVGTTNKSPYASNPADILLIKTDVLGNVEWTKTFGGPDHERVHSMIQTNDDGYAIVGSTSSFSAGLDDAYLVKTDAYGNVLWNKTFGGPNFDYASSVIQTSDGGYVLAGGNSADVWLVKTDALGNVEWSKTFGGPRSDLVLCMVQTNDGGYALGGASSDFWLVKTDSLGNIEWNNTYGGTYTDYAYSIVQTKDKGYALAGLSYYDFEKFHVLLVKTDVYGNQQWNKTYGETGSSQAHSIVQTKDNGYVLAGFTESFVGYRDFLLIKTVPFDVFVPEFSSILPMLLMIILILTVTTIIGRKMRIH